MESFRRQRTGTRKGGTPGARLPGPTVQPMRDIVAISEDGERATLSPCKHEEILKRTPGKRMRCSQCAPHERYSDEDALTSH